MNDLIAIVLAYLIGSIPFAFLLARHRGVDLRTVGSQNVGAANVLRTSGVGAAIVAMVLDAVKGTAAVLVANRLGAGPVTSMAAGLASVIGHVYPVWLRFQGGKGVATAAGVFAVLTPLAASIASAVFVIVVALTRYVSVGSISGAITLLAVALLSEVPTVIAIGAALATLIIIHRHRTNLARLAAGTERRIGARPFSDVVR